MTPPLNPFIDLLGLDVLINQISSRDGYLYKKPFIVILKIEFIIHHFFNYYFE